MRNRRPPPAIDYSVMSSYRDHPVNLMLRGGHRVDAGVVRLIGAQTVEVVTNTGAVTVALDAIEAVQSLIPETAVSEFPLSDRARGDSR